VGLGDHGTLTLRRGSRTNFASSQTGDAGRRRGAALVTGDLTDDGRDDLVAAFGQSATVARVRGEADGALATPPSRDVHSMGRPTIPHVGRSPTSTQTGLSIRGRDGQQGGQRSNPQWVLENLLDVLLDPPRARWLGGDFAQASTVDEGDGKS
jgi:hypothetical protein